jgi:hypothetical protein
VENYFNYFTEIEECFQRCRGQRILLSPLDWALIESWKEAGIPLEAVTLGIERAFEKYHARPPKFRKVNSVAYCAQEVLQAAEQFATALAETQDAHRTAAAPFSRDEVLGFLSVNARAIEKARAAAAGGNQPVLAEDLARIAQDVDDVVHKGEKESAVDLEAVENLLTALEEKLSASLLRQAPTELLAQYRAEAEKGLAPYRRNLAAVQVESLERQFLKKRLFEHYHIPRLSLFYL